MPRIVLLIGFSLLFAESSFAKDAPDRPRCNANSSSWLWPNMDLPLPDSTPWKLTGLTP